MLGGFNIRDATLKRFFVFHCFLPFVVLFLAALHVVLVHLATQNSPIPNRLHCTAPVLKCFLSALKDTAFVFVCLLAVRLLCLAVPNTFLNRHNYNPANYYATPTDIKPDWHFLSYYSVLKRFDSKRLGVLCMVSVLVFMALLPNTHVKTWLRLFSNLFISCSQQLYS